MFPQNEQVEYQILDNGDIQYLTPLPEVQIQAYASDAQLGRDASEDEYREWYLDKQRQSAWERAKYARAGFAPLTTPASDTGFIQGLDLENLRRTYRDTIASRHKSGFYGSHPAVLDMDSSLYQRMTQPLSGFSCINSNTGYYGHRFMNMNNTAFSINPRGFITAPLDSLIRGDLIQLHRPWRGGREGNRPYHTVMFDSYDEDGDVNVWDQHGKIDTVTPDFSTFFLGTPFDSAVKIPRVKSAYRFVGDEQTDQEIKKAYLEYLRRHKRWNED